MFRIQVLGVREDSRELSAGWSQKLPVLGDGIVMLLEEWQPLPWDLQDAEFR